jgi:hypothetical protein
LLHRGRADLHAIALAETIGQLLQVVAREPLAALTDGAVAGFVAKVPDLVDLTRHRRQHASVFVFDAQAQGFGAVHGADYSMDTFKRDKAA